MCAAVVKVLLPKYIRLPSGEELKKIVEGFRDELDFPQCAGVVDGIHIPIVSPSVLLIISIEGVALNNYAGNG